MEKKNIYEVKNLEGSNSVQSIVFFEKNEDGSTTEGTTLEEVIGVAIARLTELNTRFACRENSLAITKLEEAQMWLQRRTEDRIKRGVEGEHVA